MTISASSFFTPGPNGKAMFGPGGFAEGFTPKLLVGTDPSDWNSDISENHTGTATEAAGNLRQEYTREVVRKSLCTVAAQDWIRSKGYVVCVGPNGNMSIRKLFAEDGLGKIESISGQPDWLGAARWLDEQERK